MRRLRRSIDSKRVTQLILRRILRRMRRPAALTWGWLNLQNRCYHLQLYVLHHAREGHQTYRRRQKMLLVE